MNYDDRMHKLKNGSDTAQWAADEIKSLRAQVVELTEVNSKWRDYAKNEGVRRQGEIKTAIDGLHPPAAKVPDYSVTLKAMQLFSSEWVGQEESELWKWAYNKAAQEGEK